MQLFVNFDSLLLTTLKSLISIFILLMFGHTAVAQKNENLKKHEGTFRIVYASDYKAFYTLTDKKVNDKNFTDSSLMLEITDSLLTFDLSGSLNAEYRPRDNKKQMSIVKILYQDPFLSSNPSADRWRFYEIRFIEITKDAFAIHFVNKKKMAPNFLLNPASVKQRNAAPEYYNEYMADLNIVVIRDENSSKD